MLNNSQAIELYKTIVDSNEERVYKLWHASAIAMCPKAHYMKRLGVPEKTVISGAKIIRWQAGHSLETAIRPYLAKAYGAIESNQRLTSESLQLTGEFDNLVLKDNKLIEIKSVHDYAFIERDGNLSLKEQIGNWPNGNKKWATKDSPYLGHELQNHAYVLLLAETVQEIDYVYISLSGRLVVYTTQVQDKLLNEVKQRLESLNEAWGAQQAPECICKEDHELYDSVMRWCPYKTETGCCE